MVCAEGIVNETIRYQPRARRDILMIYRHIHPTSLAISLIEEQRLSREFRDMFILVHLSASTWSVPGTVVPADWFAKAHAACASDTATITS
jgi:hypothetical protein